MKAKLAVSIVGLVLLGTPHSAHADDSAICKFLTTPSKEHTPRPGMFIMYKDRANPIQINGGPVEYAYDARIYFIYGNGAGGILRAAQETSWHIKTESVERATRSTVVADETLVARPLYNNTKCSPNWPVAAFPFFPVFATLDTYLDHHPPKGDKRKPNTSLTSFFHFEVEDPRRPGTCVRTDSEAAVGDLWHAYGFDALPNTPELRGRVEQFHGKKAPGPQRAGYSSEFVIIPEKQAVCLPFTVPMPTQSTLLSQIFTVFRESVARNQASQWHPDISYIVIQQAPNISRFRTQISWTHKK